MFGFVLAMETFVALNNGVLGIVPIIKGFVAGGLELLVAFGITRLLHDRHPRELRWQAELALSGAILVLLCGYLAVYSPQRSEQKYNSGIAYDEAVLTQAEKDGQALAITAAQTRLNDDESLLHRAENSDSVIAVAIPIVELLTAELAFEGLLDLLAAQRVREADKRVRETQAWVDRIQGRIAATQNRYGLETLEILRERGINNLQDYLGGNGRATPGAPAQVAPPSPAADPNPPPPAPPTPPAGHAAPINLDGFAPAPNPQPGSGPEWDLAG